LTLLALLLHCNTAFFPPVQNDMPRTTNDTIRRIYEPLYHRHLSDAEVKEISENLTAFARAILSAAGLWAEKPEERGDVSSDASRHSLSRQ